MIDRLVDNTIPAFVAELSPFAYFLVFLGGVITSIGPCNLSMVPVIMGYVGGQQEMTRTRGFWLSLFFTFGSSITFVALGVFAVLVRGLFGAEKRLLYYFVATICALIGLHLLGVLKINLDVLTRLQPKRTFGTGLLGAFLLGLIIGLAGSQCATPILAAVLMVAMAHGGLAVGVVLLFAYGLGRGVPIIIAGSFTGVLRTLPTLTRLTSVSEKFAGLLLLAIAVHFALIA